MSAPDGVTGEAAAQDAVSSRARGKRGSYAKGQARRQQIVEEALVVFARSGFDAGSLRAIARGVGMTPAGLLHHFSSKEQLFVEVLRQRDERIREAVGDPAEHRLIEQSADVVAHNQSAPRGLSALYTTVAADAIDPAHPAHGEFVERYRDSAASAERIIAAGQAAGEIRADVDPARAGRLISAVMDGLQQQFLLDEEVDMVVLFDEFVRGYLRPL